ncbi:MAG: efflux RND transporter periplasmic adaptor subunit [Candidatus Komeilibacteria bacterium]|nr:efflux RND transporter periplasmic adaptor subunit [Candidatus Komeilibacteria bacterium]
MKKLLKSKFFWVIFGVLAVAGIVLAVKGKPAVTEEYTTDTVKLGNLVQTVSATGKVESASETNLNFKAGGQLQNIYVKAGDTVAVGQLLASLSAGQAASAVASARATVEQAQADLASVIAGARVEDLAVTEAKVVQAQADLAAKQNLLEQTKNEVTQNTLSLKEQALNRASESVFLGKESLEDIDKIINHPTYEDKLKNYTFSYQTASDSFNRAQVSWNVLNSRVSGYSNGQTEAELVEFLNAATVFLNDLDRALNDTFNLLTKVAVGGSITQTTLDTFKADINTNQTNAAAKIAVVQTAKANLQTTGVEYQNSIDQAQTDIVKAEAALKVVQAELVLKQAGPRDYELSLARAKVRQQQANLQKALADLGDYTLRAPGAGLISKINFEKGEYVSLSQPVMSLIGVSNLEIKVDAPESDIAKIKTGQTASITLDAFGDSRIFKGHVTFIDPAETIINDVVYYKIKVSFDNKEDDVKSGMTANVTMLTNSRQNVLYIPARAIVEKDNSRFVRILVNGIKEEKEVTTGLRADNGLIEILSGLTEGETIITFIKEKK